MEYVSLVACSLRSTSTEGNFKAGKRTGTFSNLFKATSVVSIEHSIRLLYLKAVFIMKKRVQLVGAHHGTFFRVALGVSRVHPCFDLRLQKHRVVWLRLVLSTEKLDSALL